ncbi:hypothetical protein MRB53_038629 [Persea americana]|nr:hypothetical protein MRB53_038629 [Persea americana]
MLSEGSGPDFETCRVRLRDETVDRGCAARLFAVVVLSGSSADDVGSCNGLCADHAKAGRNSMIDTVAGNVLLVSKCALSEKDERNHTSATERAILSGPKLKKLCCNAVNCFGIFEWLIDLPRRIEKSQCCCWHASPDSVCKNLQTTSLVTKPRRLLKHRQIRGSRACAVATTELLRRVVAEVKFKEPAQVLSSVRDVGRRLVNAQRQELVIGNIVRRVLGLIREAADSPAVGEEAHAPGSSSRVSGSHAKSSKDIKDDVLEGISEMVNELDLAAKLISEYALDHIQSDEVILAPASSTTVQKFLLQAGKKRRFTVLLLDDTDDDDAQTRTMTDNQAARSTPTIYTSLKALKAAGLTTAVIQLSAVSMFMPRVSKVILSAHAMTPNGGFVSKAGVRMIANVAKDHRVPVVVLGAVYKLSAVFPYDESALDIYTNPGNTARYDDSEFIEEVAVTSMLDEYVPPDLTTVFVTNM